MNVPYSDTPNGLKEEILQNFTSEEQARLAHLEKQILRKYVNLGRPRDGDLVLKPSRDAITESLRDKNLVVMCGGGKDSEVVLAGARSVQLSILEEYGMTFKMRVCVGRHPGMIDVDENLDRAFQALKLYDDVNVELLYVDGKDVRPFDKGAPIPQEVTTLNRDNVLMNGHMFSGAGRRTFCDDCNKNLGGWTTTALSYDGGADLFMTGDSPKELRTQIGADVPALAESLGATIALDGDKTVTQQSFELLNAVGERHSEIVHGDAEAVRQRSFDTEGIPDRTEFVPFFNVVGYESRDRLPLLTDFLGFDFDSLMFSFTETDCANPALMAHLYGLIAEHCYGDKGSTYADGVRMYVEYGTSKMEEKGFPNELIEKMKERYKDDAAIDTMREKVEAYAKRAYNFEPEHLVAMVYAPFAQNGKNLERYLNHLKQADHPMGNQLATASDKIKQALASDKPLEADEQPFIDALEESTGLTLPQMRRLYQHLALAIDNFDPEKQHDLTTIMNQGDTLYQGLGNLGTTDDPVQIKILGR